MDNKQTYEELEQRVKELEIANDKLKQTEESETQNRQIVETMQEALGVTDSNYVLTHVNEKFCRLLEYSPDEMVGHHLSEFIVAARCTCPANRCFSHI